MSKESKYSSFRLNKPYENSYLIFDFFGDIGSAAVQSNTEKKIAEENLNYQRERNAIEDARYEEETAYNRNFAENERDYNRAFAENERDYNRALQQQIFNREDTALERQANQLSKLGINPLTQQLNGLESGSVVSSSAPAAASAPSTSSRGGQALHNDYKPSEVFGNIAGPLLEAINAIDNVNTSGVQRDSIRAQTNYQNLLNESQALDNKYKEIEIKERLKNLEADTEGKKTDNARNKRVNDFQERTGLTDMNVGGIQNIPNAAWIGEQTQTASEKRLNASNPLEYTGNKIKHELSVVGDSLANTFGKGAKKALNIFTKGKNWIKKHTVPAEQLRDMYGF